MAIYADKNAKGELTGRFRVELQKGTERYRQRHDTLALAKADEERVKTLWAAGVADVASTRSGTLPVAPAGISMAEGIEVATGVLWHRSTNEALNYAHLRFFAKTWGQGILLDDIDTQKVRQGIRSLERLDKSNGTINRYLSHLRTFLAWHVKERNRKLPVEDIVWDWRKESKGRLRWLTYDEEATLLTLVPANIAKLIQVALATGCRREELVSAQLDWVTDDTLHIPADVTKNNEARSLPITLETATRLRELLSGEMPSTRTLRRRWDVAKAKMGLQDDKEFVFHTCRHTCATRMVSADVDVLIIKEWLGHKRIETTQRYAKVDPRKLRTVLGRMGELRAMSSDNVSFPGAFSPPPLSPTPGGIVPEALAA
jgi:integrase